MNCRLFIILISTISSFLFSSIGYNYIYLMEFENVNSDFTIANLSKALPDIIINNYEFRGDITVEYLTSIDPYLPKTSSGTKENAIIINGRFISSDNNVDIDVELYDLSTWESLGNSSFYCPIEDMTCIHDAFVITIEELLDQYVVVEESQSFKLGQNVTKKIVYSKDQIVDNTEMFKDALTIDVIADAEFNIDLSKNDKKELLDDTVISREFDFSNNKNLSKDPIETNTEKMTQILNQFLINPYDIIIGEMAVELNKYNTDILDITIPIEFSINKGLVDQLLSDIPNDIIYNKNGNISMQLSNSNFTFDQSLITQLATMRYQIIPIYSFLDESENIQLLIIDTWEKKYKNLLIGGNDILYTNQYTPLYTIKSDSYNIYINLDINTSIVTYSFSVPYNTFGDYTKLIVDFMLEDELDQYLNVE